MRPLDCQLRPLRNGPRGRWLWVRLQSANVGREPATSRHLASTKCGHSNVSNCFEADGWDCQSYKRTTQRRKRRGVAVVRRRAWATVAKEFGAEVAKRVASGQRDLINLKARYRGRYRATYMGCGVVGNRRHMHSDHRRQPCGAQFRGLYVQIFLRGRGPASTLGMAGTERKLSHVGRRSVRHEKRRHVDDAPHGRRRC